MAGEASRAAGQTFPSERPGLSCHTIAEPLGVVAAICPWNFPVVTPGAQDRAGADLGKYRRLQAVVAARRGPPCSSMQLLIKAGCAASASSIW